MKVMLIISFLVMDQWIPAKELKLDGWYPREQPSMEVCLGRAEHINTTSKYKPHIKAHCELQGE